MRYAALARAALALLPFLSSAARATDHNEPDLVNSFYKDRDGSGADIYGLFAYPSEDGSRLNLIMTLAPVPETGRFDPNSVQRIYLMPSRSTNINERALQQELVNPTSRPRGTVDSVLLRSVGTVSSDALDFVNRLRAFEDYVIKPIIGTNKRLLDGALSSNNIPIDQKEFAEIRAEYSKSGTWAKLTFRNFNFPGGGEKVLTARSNGNAKDPKWTYDFEGMQVFVGGRDDPFFTDIGGFFRSINYAAAVDGDNNFRWEGDISYRATGAEKESNDRRKRLLDREQKRGFYSGKDWREGNNINALSFTIPLEYLVRDRARDDLLLTWVESFLTEAAYNRINL